MTTVPTFNTAEVLTISYHHLVGGSAGSSFVISTGNGYLPSTFEKLNGNLVSRNHKPRDAFLQVLFHLFIKVNKQFLLWVFTYCYGWHQASMMPLTSLNPCLSIFHVTMSSARSLIHSLCWAHLSLNLTVHLVSLILHGNNRCRTRRTFPRNQTNSVIGNCYIEASTSSSKSLSLFNVPVLTTRLLRFLDKHNNSSIMAGWSW